MEQKAKYNHAELEIISFEAQDVIATSVVGGFDHSGWTQTSSPTTVDETQDSWG